MRIAEALRHPGQTVTVAGVVTSPRGLLDSDGRRVTIQDGQAAILLRLPDDAAAPGIGVRVRVTGDVGTYYGAPQLAAAEAPVPLGKASAAPTILHRAPTASDEWLLVRVTIRVSDISRSGDAWRAEVSLGSGGTLPVAGLAASHVPATALLEGREATITGIVHRAYPTASDQRYSVDPRSASDIVLGSAPVGSPAPSHSPPGSSLPDSTVAHPGAATAGPSGWVGIVGSTGGVETAVEPTGTAPGETPGAPRETLDQLPALVGQRVEVAGSIVELDGPLATIDDGTAQAVIRAPSALDAGDAPLLVGDVINAVGIVAERDVGGWEIVVSAAADIVRAPDLADGTPDAGPTGSLLPDRTAGPGDVAPAGPSAGSGAAGSGRLLSGLLVGVGLAGILASGGVAAYRRRVRARGSTQGSQPDPGEEASGEERAD